MPALSEILEAIELYDSKKHSEKFYDYHIKRIGRAVEPGEQLATDVRNLFYWFLGKVHENPGNPIYTVYIGSDTYYISETAPDNKAAVDEAVKNESLWAGLAFRNGNLPVDNLITKAKTLTKNSIIIPSFFIHIFNPDEYPILNNKVWAAYREELGKEVYKNTRPKKWDNYLEYVSYCAYLMRKTGLPLRDIDKGLYVIGERLMTEARDTVENEEPEDSGQVGLF
jgi:hypothetical protein